MAVLAFSTLTATSQGLNPGNSSAMLPYQNPNLSAETRAEDLITRLTLEEKTKLMMDESPAIDRLGIPQFQWWNEALHGVGRNGFATVFPITMHMAASWDDELLYKVFTAVSDEARAKAQEAKKSGEVRRYQCLSFWTPNINIFRDPRWGRGQETYGEDPYLTSRMGLAVVNGLQGQSFDGKPLPAPGCKTSTGAEGATSDNAPKYVKLLACAKHFAVHSGPEWNRHVFNLENLPERDLWETYLPAFKTLVQEGNVAEIMCAYQRIDGAPCCSNARYERQILRDEWGFKGLITSDCGAIDDFYVKGYHGTAKNPAEATAQAIGTGTDVECGNAYRALPEAVKAGLISEDKVNESLKRLLVARFRLGNFDNDENVGWTKIPASVIASKEHKDLALKIAEEGIVLLQNKNGILPLRKNQKIVVMGPNANDSIMQWGNYNGKPTATTTILQGIRRCVGTEVKYVRACTLTRSLTNSKNDKLTYSADDATGRYATTCEQVVAEAADADVVVFVGGISPSVEGEQMDVSEPGFKGGDRTDIELPTVQRKMIEALHRAGKRVVFVCCSGSAVAMVPETENAEAILQAWYPGERGGEAVAKVLFGEVNPSGKLPVTFYRHTADLPDYLDYTMKNRTYRYFKGNVLFPFGHGLSYTQFKYGKDLKLKSNNNKNADYSLELTLSNTGKRDGTEVAQVYIRRVADADGPIKSLRAFKRVSLKAGEQQKVSIDLPRKSFETWDAHTNTMRVVPGKYKVFVGGSSADASNNVIEVKLK